MNKTSILENTINGIIGAVIALVSVYVKGFISRKKASASINALQAAGDVITIMEEASRSLGTSRLLLLFTSNGGGKPSAGCPLHTTILYEYIHKEGITPIREAYQSRLLDMGYLKFMRDLLANEWLDITPKDLDKGFLKDLYLSEGIKRANVIPVYSTEKRFYFLSARWDQDGFPNHETRKVIMQSAATRIAKILEKSDLNIYNPEESEK